MITTCKMPIINDTGDIQWQPGNAATHTCNNPIDPAYYKSGPWMCQSCRDKSLARQQQLQLRSSYVPMAADVWQYMQQHNVDQNTAVRALGGTP